MIIRIMGTSGSGKTTLVRRLMESIGRTGDCFLHPRKTPIGHYLKGGTLVVGYYHDHVGGCDNLPSNMRDRDWFFGTFLPDRATSDRHVLYEGVVFGDEVTRTVVLARTHPSVIVYLTTPLDECLSSIAKRRAAQGKEPTFNQNQTIARHRQLQNVAQRLRSSGIKVEKLDRQGAYVFIKMELNK